MLKIKEVGWSSVRAQVDSRERKTTVCKECELVSETTEDGGVACVCVEIWLLSGLISQPNQRESVSYSIVFHRSGAKRQQMMSMQTFSSSSN